MAEIIELHSSPITPAFEFAGNHNDGRLPGIRMPNVSVGVIDKLDVLLSDGVDLPISRPTEQHRRSVPKGRIRAYAPAGSRERPFCLFSDQEPPNNDPQNTTAAEDPDLPERHGDSISDTVTFNSSIPGPKIDGVSKTSASNLSSDDLPEIFFDPDRLNNLSQPTVSNTCRSYVSDCGMNSIPNARCKPHSIERIRTRPGGERSIRSQVSNSPPMEDAENLNSSPAKRVGQKIVKSMKENILGKETRAAARIAAKATKARNQAAEKDQKRITKALKAREKEEAMVIAELNKSKTDKKISAAEMIVEVSRCLQGKSVGDHLSHHMSQLGVNMSYVLDEIDLQHGEHAGPPFAGSVVKWKRKVSARYNDDLGRWEPLAMTTLDQEPHVLIHLTALDFAKIVTTGLSPGEQDAARAETAMVKAIDVHVTALRETYKNCQPIYLIEGLTVWLRRNKSSKNRAYVTAVLAQIPVQDQLANPASFQARRKKDVPSAPDYSLINDDIAETLLLHLQIRHGVLIQQCTSPSTSAEWIKNFTEHISTIPYRQQRMAMNDHGAAFCMDVGQVKTGENPLDTYLRMLQEVQRVTPAMAYGIANEYTNVQKLVSAFRQHGPSVLADLRKSANKDGAIANARLGPVASKRLYKVFMGTNPSSTDGLS